MAWWGKVVGGTFGFMLGGPIGAMLGAALGHKLDSGLAGFDGDQTYLPASGTNPGCIFYCGFFGYGARCQSRRQGYLPGDLPGTAVDVSHAA